MSTDQQSLMYPPQSNPASPDNTAKYGQALLNTQYTWAQDADGTWGWTLETITGNFNPSDNQGNGCIVSYSWIDGIFNYRGSGNPTNWSSGAPALGPGSKSPDDGVETSPRPVKVMISRDWGETIIQEVHALSAVNSTNPPSLTQTVTSEGDLTVTTNVGNSKVGTHTLNTTTVMRSVTNNFGSDDLMKTALEWWGINTGVSVAFVVAGAAVGKALPLGGDGGVPNWDGPPPAAGSTDGAGNVVWGPEPPYTAPGGYWSGRAVGEDVLGLGKFASPAMGGIEGKLNVVSSAVSETTTIKGPASYDTTVYGTTSTTNKTIGGVSTMDLLLGTASSIKIGVMSSDVEVAGILSKMKFAGMSSDTLIGIQTNRTVFSLLGTINDLTTRIVNQAPLVTVNYLNMTLAGVNHFKTVAQKADMAAMHSFGSLLHILL
jgi:hypothetical protein